MDVTVFLKCTTTVAALRRRFAFAKPQLYEVP